MGFRTKIVSYETLSKWRNDLSKAKLKVVVTNGCFDILHLGHVIYLEEARKFGDRLLVGINGDESVTALKGSGRPINPESDRAGIVAALESVSGVCVFSEIDAANFLKLARPDIYVKGGDYTIHTINQKERKLIEEMGGKVKIVSGIVGRSTSSLIRKIG